jgi:hypothetical protein
MWVSPSPADIESMIMVSLVADWTDLDDMVGREESRGESNLRPTKSKSLAHVCGSRHGVPETCADADDLTLHASLQKIADEHE